MDAPPGVPGVSKNSQKYATNKTVELFVKNFDAGQQNVIKLYPIFKLIAQDSDFVHFFEPYQSFWQKAIFKSKFVILETKMKRTCKKANASSLEVKQTNQEVKKTLHEGKNLFNYYIMSFVETGIA